MTNSPDNFFWHDTGALISEGAHQAQQLDRDRKQWTAAATYFLDTGMGSHTFKMGGELLKEQSWEGYTSRRGGTSNIEQVYANGLSSQVIFGIPTARSVNSLSAHNDLLSRAPLDQVGMFVNDTWAWKPCAWCTTRNGIPGMRTRTSMRTGRMRRTPISCLPR